MESKKISAGYEKYDGHIYYVITFTDKVIAIARCHGRNVRAISKCHPNDTFNSEIGKNIAIARLNLKIKKIRAKVLRQELENAHKDSVAAKYIFEKVEDRYLRARYEEDKAYEQLCYVMASVKK